MFPEAPMPFPNLHQHQHEPHEADPPTATAADPTKQQADWPIPSWQWASLVALLLGGQAVLLVLTVWTLATSATHGWPTSILLALGLLARLVPDALKLAAWAATAQTWMLPIDRHLHLGIAIGALVLAVLVTIAT
jgi:hypothetical protein